MLLPGLAVVTSPSAAQAEPPATPPTPTTTPPTTPSPTSDPDMTLGDKHDEAQKDLVPGASSPARPEVDAASEPPKREDDDDPWKKFTVSGYLETFYQWSFNVPGNGISSYRGYDNRHNTISLQNAVLDVGFRARDILARIALQGGLAPSTIYQDEADVAAGPGAGSSDAKLWQHLQRASLGWQATHALLLEAGIFPSVTGVESLAVKENWNWSRSTSSTRLPNYQAGARATVELTPQVDLFAAVVNGWNRVVDDNDEKSVIVGMHYRLADKLTVSGSYFGGVERSAGAPEGRPWRHGFETWTQLDLTKSIQLAADASAGFENTRFGVEWWSSAAGYLRGKLLSWLFLAGRVDRTWDDPAASARGTSQPILLPSKHVTSFTGTVDVRPVKGLSTRLELRHDTSQAPIFFRGEVTGDGTAQSPYLPNARRQTTLLLGVVAWF